VVTAADSLFGDEIRQNSLCMMSRQVVNLPIGPTIRLDQKRSLFLTLHVSVSTTMGPPWLHFRRQRQSLFVSLSERMSRSST
jgi:hypothetical protein